MSLARSEVERLILLEEEVLLAIATHLRGGRPMSAWEPRERDALLLALLDPDLPAPEERKATALRRHLFGAEPPSLPEAPRTPDRVLRRCAERVRADLASLVPLRSGL